MVLNEENILNLEDLVLESGYKFNDELSYEDMQVKLKSLNQVLKELIITCAKIKNIRNDHELADKVYTLLWVCGLVDTPPLREKLNEIKINAIIDFFDGDLLHLNVDNLLSKSDYYIDKILFLRSYYNQILNESQTIECEECVKERLNLLEWVLGI